MGSLSLRIALNIMLSLAAAGSPVLSEELPVTETIVMVRHGEKPADGLGQLNCQGPIAPSRCPL
jgi:hypothetical protein